MQLRDKKPSMLLNGMQRLGGTSCSTQLLKTLWLQQLPIVTQWCLTMSSGTIEELAKLADKISEIDQQRVVINAVSDSTSEILNTLIKEFEVELVSARNNNRSWFNNSNRSRPRSPSSSRATFNKWKMGENNYCFYHANFGKKARKCAKPCKYNQL